jgi:hypothetical protein
MGLDQSVERTSVAGSRAALRGRANTLYPGLIVTGVVLLSIAVRYALALDQHGPWLMGDELLYSDRAKAFLEQGRLLFREEYNPFATAYPVLIAPAWIANVETAYEIAKAINVVLMTLSAVVVFVWARRLAATPYALVAGGLVLLMPTFDYTGLIMTESVALPSALLAMFVVARALERPTLAWQLGALAAIGLAALMRVQLLTLGLVLLTAIVLDALLAKVVGRGLRASLAPFVPTFAIVAMGGLAYVAFKALSGASLTTGLGAYSFVGEGGYDLVDVGRWFVWSAGELALSVGFLPAVALGLLLAAAIRHGRSLTVADRAFVAVALATSFWFVVQAAAYASRFSQRIEERYMLYAAPLLLLALAVWIGRSLPRSPVSILVAAVVPALLVTTIPYERLFNISLVADTFGLIPFMRLSNFLDDGVGDLKIVVAVGLAVAVVWFLAFPERVARVVFPAAVAVFLLLSGYSVHGALEDQSQAALGATGTADHDWVDDAIGSDGETGFIYGQNAAANPHLLWQTEFWNRSVRGVYPLGADPVSSFSDDELQVDRSGRLVSKYTGKPIVEEPYVLAEPSLGIVGKVAAAAGPLALIRVDPPARLARALDGVYADGWTGPRAALTQFAPLPGGARRLKVKVGREGWGGPGVPARVTIAAGPLRTTDAGPVLARTTAKREWAVQAGRARTFSIPVPRGAFRVEVGVTPTFSPSEYGSPDTRQLGVQLSFAPG